MSIGRQHRAPRTFAEAVRYFADAEKCQRLIVAARWPDGITCPFAQCGGRNVAVIATRGIWRCRTCRRQFSTKVGTIFEDSALGLDKWLPVVWLVGSPRATVSTCDVARALHIPQKTAWFMRRRLVIAMSREGRETC